MRRNTCGQKRVLALRLLSVIALLEAKAVPWTLLIPHQCESQAVSILSISENSSIGQEVTSYFVNCDATGFNELLTSLPVEVGTHIDDIIAQLVHIPAYYDADSGCHH